MEVLEAQAVTVVLGVAAAVDMVEELAATEVVGQPTPYQFGYDVKDEYGNSQSRQESGDGSGTVKGSYGYTDTNGIYRQVNYVADQNGFRAVVKTNEPGVGPASPADAEFIVEAPPAGVVSQYAGARGGGGYGGAGGAGGYGGAGGAGGYGAAGGAGGYGGGHHGGGGAGGFGGAHHGGAGGGAGGHHGGAGGYGGGAGGIGGGAGKFGGGAGGYGGGAGGYGGSAGKYGGGSGGYGGGAGGAGGGSGPWKY
ncbi:hypothetical protein HPB50_009149 [Hyalomma asiaticum]|uniref:Uncharacterized protein n=1 Tax=Hyalomma asiaticum TaxID=266040 RepID=A0ACB7S4Z7_HYAAI|nr:hypothetical protein HPB50_009149 [Hyalomma asiaticum]